MRRELGDRRGGGGGDGWKGWCGRGEHLEMDWPSLGSVT
jgi:hypothetical protein